MGLNLVRPEEVQINNFWSEKVGGRGHYLNRSGEFESSGLSLMRAFMESVRHPLRIGP